MYRDELKRVWEQRTNCQIEVNTENKIQLKEDLTRISLTSDLFYYIEYNTEDRFHETIGTLFGWDLFMAKAIHMLDSPYK